MNHKGLRLVNPSARLSPLQQLLELTWPLKSPTLWRSASTWWTLITFKGRQKHQIRFPSPGFLLARHSTHPTWTWRGAVLSPLRTERLEQRLRDVGNTRFSLDQLGFVGQQLWRRRRWGLSRSLLRRKDGEELRSPKMKEIMIIAYQYTARGGGGSFKKRKTIGEIGCREPRMSEQKHWPTD